MKMLLWTGSMALVGVLSACGGGSGGGGQNEGLPAQAKADVQKVEFRATDCPTLTGHYRRHDDRQSDQFSFIEIRYRYSSMNPVTLDMQADQPYIVDGVNHEQPINEDARKQGITSASYKAWCENGTLTFQIFMNGRYGGATVLNEVNANHDLRVRTDYSAMGQSLHEDFVYKNVP